VLNFNNIPDDASTVLINGSIYTFNPGHPWAQALTGSQGKIAYVGSNRGAGAFIRPDTNVFDLEGKMVLPGFVDAHAHPSWGIDFFSRANLYSSKSLDEYRMVIEPATRI
jgi:predicted amidohydrolase YtcJ